MSILENMLKRCACEGYTTTKNVEKVAKAKNMMFGADEWHRCPCDSSNENRYCISEQCKQDIERTGECHCHCYTKAPAAE